MLKYLAKKDKRYMENLVFAYLGDAVYELYIREHLIKEFKNVNDLQKEAVKYVSAKAQSEVLSYLMEKNLLTEEEIDIVKKGRNAHSHSSKTTDIITYKRSTGLECLIGYLYLNNKERLEEIMGVIVSERV